MNNPDTKELFRYYGNTDRARDVLLNNQVFIPHPSLFNDPFDGSIPFDSTYTAAEFRDWAIKLGKRRGQDKAAIEKTLLPYFKSDGSLTDFAISTIESVSKDFDESNGKMGVLCLTEDCVSILMWSHYANKHQGVCIGFTREPSSELGDDDACSPVQYDDTYPTPRFLEIFSDDGSLTQALFYRKAMGWKYEREWRLLFETANLLVPIPGSISRVILGCRCDDKVKDAIRDACAAKSIPLFSAIQTPGEFSLKLDKY